MLLWIILAVLIVLGLVVFFGTFFIVRQQFVGVIERLGKYNRQQSAGLGIKIPLLESVVKRMSLRVQELVITLETKTKDNVFVKVKIAVQFAVDIKRVYDACYKLTSRDQQIESYVMDVVRARIPKIELDSVFEEKDDVANAVKEHLSEVMDDYGYNIINALVVDIDPDEKVKNAMNDINAATRLRIAATEKGEAEKILVVKAAEADALSKKLSGTGIADQRIEIAKGFSQSVEEIKKSAGEGISEETILNVLMMVQFFDTQKDIAQASKTNTMFLPSGPGAMTDLFNQMTNAVSAGNISSKFPDIRKENAKKSPETQED